MKQDKNYSEKNTGEDNKDSTWKGAYSDKGLSPEMKRKHMETSREQLIGDATVIYINKKKDKYQVVKALIDKYNMTEVEANKWFMRAERYYAQQARKHK